MVRSRMPQNKNILLFTLGSGHRNFRLSVPNEKKRGIFKGTPKIPVRISVKLLNNLLSDRNYRNFWLNDKQALFFSH